MQNSVCLDPFHTMATWVLTNALTQSEAQFVDGPETFQFIFLSSKFEYFEEHHPSLFCVREELIGRMFCKKREYVKRKGQIRQIRRFENTASRTVVTQDITATTQTMTIWVKNIQNDDVTRKIYSPI